MAHIRAQYALRIIHSATLARFITTFFWETSLVRTIAAIFFIVVVPVAATVTDHFNSDE